MEAYGRETFTRLTRGPTPEQGLTAVAVTRLLDAGTTLLGLSLVPSLREANPVARAVFQAVGAPIGVLGLSLLAVVAIGCVTELGAALTVSDGDGETDGFAAAAVRYVGYGTPSFVSLVAAVHNLHLTVSAHPAI